MEILQKKIAFISMHGDPLATPGGIQSGGQNVYVRNLALQLDKLGWRVDIYTRHAETTTPAIQELGEGKGAG